MPKRGRIWGGGGAGSGVPAAAPRRGWGALCRPARRTAARWSGPARGAWAGRRGLYFIDLILFFIPFGKKNAHLGKSLVFVLFSVTLQERCKSQVPILISQMSPGRPWLLPATWTSKRKSKQIQMAATGLVDNSTISQVYSFISPKYNKDLAALVFISVGCAEQLHAWGSENVRCLHTGLMGELELKVWMFIDRQEAEGVFDSLKVKHALHCYLKREKSVREKQSCGAASVPFLLAAWARFVSNWLGASDESFSCFQ